jgi:hypothetical protein
MQFIQENPAHFAGFSVFRWIGQASGDHIRFNANWTQTISLSKKSIPSTSKKRISPLHGGGNPVFAVE